MKEHLFDKRVVQRALQEGLLDKDVYQRMLDALPDLSHKVQAAGALEELRVRDMAPDDDLSDDDDLDDEDDEDEDDEDEDEDEDEDTDADAKDDDDTAQTSAASAPADVKLAEPAYAEVNETSEPAPDADIAQVPGAYNSDT